MFFRRNGRGRKAVSITTAIAAAVATLTGIGVQLQGAKAAAAGAGVPDQSFSDDGVFAEDFLIDTAGERVAATTVGFFNRTVVAVYENASDRRSTVVRLTTNGRFDSGFSGDGRASVDLSEVVPGATSGRPIDVATDYQDRIVLLSSVATSAGNYLVLTRFTPKGQLDTSFDPDVVDDGSVVHTFAAGRGYNFPRAIAIDDLKGIIYVAGSDRSGSGDDQAVVGTYAFDGNYFELGPELTYPTTAQSEYFDIALDARSPGREVVAVGYVNDTSIMPASEEGDFVINRFNAETGYDAAYAPGDGNGRFAHFLAGNGEQGVSVAVNGVGSVVVGVADRLGADPDRIYHFTDTGAQSGVWNGGEPLELSPRYRVSGVGFDTGGVVVGGSYNMSGSSTATGFVTRYGEDGALDTSYNPGSGESFFDLGDLTNIPPTLAVDREQRVVVGFSDATTSGVARFTADYARLESATRVLFDDTTESGDRSIYGMAPSSEEIVEVVAGDGGVSYERPVANQNGTMYYEKHESGNVDVMAANAGDGGNQRRVTPAFALAGAQIRRPTVDQQNDTVFVIADDGVNGPCAYAVIENEQTYGGSSCGISDLAVNPNARGKFAYIRGGDIFLNNIFNTEETLVIGGVDATRIEWGMDGTVLLFDNNASVGAHLLQTLTWNSTDDVYNAHQPEYYTQPTEPFTVTQQPTPFTSFVMAPDGSADHPIIWTNQYEDEHQIVHHSLDGTSAINRGFNGVAPRIGAWPRNLSVYPVDGPETSVEPTSIAVEDVPLQSQAPAAQSANSGANVEAAGILRLNLLSSPLLRLNLLSSPLLRLNLLSSPLLRLNLLSSPIGLGKMGISDDLGGSPLVQAGLQRITLSQLGILTGPGWRDRLTAAGVSDEARRLATLPLQSVTLADVIGLSPGIEFPSLEELDLTQSPFGTISVLPFLMGDTRLHQIGGIDWCGVFQARGAADCGAAYGVPGSTFKGRSASLLSLQISGFNLDDLPTTGGVRNDLRTITYDQVAFNSDTSLLPNFVLKSVDTNAASVGGTLLHEITPSANTVVDCALVDCTNTALTLDAANRANALRPDAVVSQLGDALDGFRLNELALGLWGTPGDDPYDQSPAALGIDPAVSAGDGKAFVVSYSRMAMGGGTTDAPTVTVQMPFGYVLIPDSAEFYNSASLMADDWLPAPAPSQVGRNASWQLPTVLNNGDFLQLRFRAFATAAVDDQLRVIVDDGFHAQEVGSETLRTVDPNEADTLFDAPPLLPDHLYFSRLESSTDVDIFKIHLNDGRFDMPTGSTINVYLSQLRYDADLTVFHPAASQRGFPLRPVSDAPDINGVPDKAVTVTNQGEPLIGEGDADVPLLPNHALAGLSSNRGTRAEKVATIVWPGSDNGDDFEGQAYFLQVSGYNGAHGPESYAIRFTVTPPPSAPAGAPRAPGFSGPGSAEVEQLPADAPHPESLILTNPTRLAHLYGAAEAANTAASVQQLAAATNGVVLPVDSFVAVRNKYDDWDAAPNDAERANDLVRIINDEVDWFLGNGHRQHLKSIVLVGTDEILPMARLQDLTQTANERTFAQELRDLAQNSGGNNALLGAALAGKILSDDPYGAFSPRRFDGEWLYVPDVALGRLVETPQQITAQVDEFLNGGDAGDDPGTVKPTSSLSAGADFMTLLAESIQDSFNQQMPNVPASNKQTLIGDTWTRTDLANALGASAPSLIAINSHYSPQALQPGSRLDPTHPDNPNLSATDMAGASDFRRRLLFTMGCHSGFNITNYFSGDTTDFPEALAADTAGAFIGNTGFGIGVRDFNAFSQRLFEDFAALLAQADFGTALKQAKQQYLAEGITNPYDLKVLAEATYFGIPQYKLDGAAPVVTPKDEQPEPNFAGGILAAPVTVEQPVGGDEWSKKTTDDGSYYSLTSPGSDHLIVQDRPVQPKRTKDVTAANENLRAVDVFVDELVVGAAEANFDPVLLRPQVASGPSNSDEVKPSELVFPFTFADVSNFTDIDGSARQKLLVVPAQFSSTGSKADGTLVGTETRFSKIGGKVLYQNLADENRSVDTTKPALSLGRAVANDGGGVDFSVRVTDAESAVARVVALYRVGDDAEFRLLELTPGDAGAEGYDENVFRGHLPSADEDLEVLFEAVNGASLVGWFANKGHYFAAAPADVITPAYSATPIAQDPATFDGPVTVRFNESGPDQSALMTFSLNGGPERNYHDNEIALKDPGDYTIAYRSNVGDAAGVLHVRIVEPGPEVVTVIYDRFKEPNGFFTGPTVATITSDKPQSQLAITVNGQPTTSPIHFGDPAHPGTAADGVYVVEYSTNFGTVGREVVALDTKDPTVTIDKPAASARYLLNQNVAADYDCADANLVSCEGTVADGARLDTATVTDGTTPRSFAVTAVDAAGRAKTVTRNYTVGYAPEGPCRGTTGHTIIGEGKTDLVSPMKTVRFTLCDANGNAVAKPAEPPALGLPVEVNADGSLGSPAIGGCPPFLGVIKICLPLLSQQPTNRWVLRGDTWSFQQDTTYLAPGAHRFRVFLRDGTTMDYVMRRQLLRALDI